jgi:hypothetical protein
VATLQIGNVGDLTDRKRSATERLAATELLESWAERTRFGDAQPYGRGGRDCAGGPLDELRELIEERGLQTVLVRHNLGPWLDLASHTDSHQEEDRSHRAQQHAAPSSETPWAWVSSVPSAAHFACTTAGAIGSQVRSAPHAATIVCTRRGSTGLVR